MKKIVLTSLAAGLFLAGCGEDYMLTNKDLPDDILKSPQLEECRTQLKEKIADIEEHIKRFESANAKADDIKALKKELKDFKNPPTKEDKIKQWKFCTELSKDLDSMEIIKRHFKNIN